MAGKKREHCKRGHKMEGDNVGTVTRKDGRTGRYCKTCNRSHLRDDWSLFHVKPSGNLDGIVRELNQLVKEE